MNKSLSITVRETPSTPMSDPDGVLARSGGRRAPTSTEVRSRSSALQRIGGPTAPAPRSVRFRTETGPGYRPDARRALLRHSGTHHLCPCAHLIALYESSPLHGQEIDLILECEDGRVIVVEAKVEAAKPPRRCPPPMPGTCGGWRRGSATVWWPASS